MKRLVLLSAILASAGCELLLGDGGKGADASETSGDAGGLAPDASAPWTVTLGTQLNDWVGALAVNPAGEAALVGYTEGKLGSVSAGGTDAFLARYRADGSRIFLQQVGSASSDYFAGVAEDVGGQTYVAGWTTGDLWGALQSQAGDGIVGSFDATGQLACGTHVSPNASRSTNLGALTRLPGGDLFAFGCTGPGGGCNQGLLARISTQCGVVKLTEFGGTPLSVIPQTIAHDPSGNLLVGGSFDGTFAGVPANGAADGFAARLSPDGQVLWLVALGTPEYEVVTSVIADDAVYVVGTTGGLFPDSGGSAGGGFFLARHKLGDGAREWIRQWGSPAGSSPALAFGQSGSILCFADAPAGDHSAGQVRSFDRQGNLLSSVGFGATRGILGNALAVDGDGSLYLAGTFFGSIDGSPESASGEIFLKRMAPP